MLDVLADARLQRTGRQLRFQTPARNCVDSISHSFVFVWPHVPRFSLGIRCCLSALNCERNVSASPLCDILLLAERVGQPEQNRVPHELRRGFVVTKLTRVSNEFYDRAAILHNTQDMESCPVNLLLRYVALSIHLHIRSIDIPVVHS